MGGKKGIDIILVEQAPIPEANPAYYPTPLSPHHEQYVTGKINFVEFTFQRHLTQCMKENVYAI